MNTLTPTFERLVASASERTFDIHLGELENVVSQLDRSHLELLLQILLDYFAEGNVFDGAHPEARAASSLRWLVRNELAVRFDAPASLFDRLASTFPSNAVLAPDFRCSACEEWLVVGESCECQDKRRRMHGQVLISRQGGAAKRGIGGIVLLSWCFAVAAATQVSFYQSGTLPTIIGVSELMPVETGYYDVCLTLDGSLSSGFVNVFCQTCYNQATPVALNYSLSVDTVVGDCQLQLLEQFSAAVTQEFVRVCERGVYVQEDYSLDMQCQLSTSAVGTLVMASSFSKTYQVDGKKLLGRLGAGAKKGDGPKFEEWLAKHPAWHGKGHADQLKAFQAALKQSQAAAAPVKVVDVMKKSVVHQKAIAHSSKRVNLAKDNPYLASILDPFMAPISRVPDYDGQATVPFRLQQTVMVQADTRGQAVAFLRPGLGHAIAVSGAMSDATVPWNTSPGIHATAADLPEIVYGAGSTEGFAEYFGDNLQEYPYPPPWTADGYSIQRMRNWDKTRAMRDFYGSTRAVSAGLSARNIANKFEAEGRAVGLNWEGDLGLPGLGNSSVSIGRTDGDTGELVGPSGLTYENVINLDGRVEAKGADGITCHAVITGARAITDFRQTQPKASYIDPVASAIWRNDATVTGDVEAIDFAPAMCDSAVTQRFCDSFLGLNPTVSAASRAVTAAPAVSNPLAWTDNVSAGGQVTTNYSDTTLYGAQLATDSTVGADNSTENVGIVKKSMQRVMNAHILSAMSPGDCGVLLMFSGLKPSTKIADGGSGRFLLDVVAEPIEVEVVCNFEGIPRTGTVEFQKQKTMPVRARLAAPLVKSVANDIAQIVPVAHSGPHETVANKAGVTSSGTPVLDWIKGAASTASHVAEAVSGIGDQLPWLADAAASLYAFLI